MDEEVRVLFHELADLPPAQRERVLRERQIAPAVRREVESLLSFDGVADQLFTSRVAGVAQDVLRSAVASPPAECGPYRLVRLLGSGGMGSVYLADRMDGELRQQVAVKLLHPANRAGWRERFLRERQLLASLNHPSIVRVLDAGHTGDGRPYLVMEYVAGSPVDAFAAGIGVRERLGLFLRICDAVSHAHARLIIHRDLKPSNILVERSGTPKLLDFGIAKLLDETGDQTRTVDRLLTPYYASPEQVHGALQTTATDIYSLGAVLFKMLTGRCPREAAAESGAQEVPAPSRLNRDLPPDLDYIVRKALRSEPEERYASVETFAADVRACLESRPVAARHGNALYRTRKFLRRYWVPVTAAALALAGLTTGLYVANRARAVAERRFLQVRQLANQFLALDATLQHLPGATQARRQIVTTSLAYLNGLRAEARSDTGLLLEIGNAYLQVARVQGVPTAPNLGDFAQAEETLVRAEAVVDQVVRSRPQDRVALRASAEIAHDRMILGTGSSRDQVLSEAHKAAARLNALLALPRSSAADRVAAARIFTNMTQAYNNLGMYDDAIRSARRAGELAAVPDPSAQRMRSSALVMLAGVQQRTGDLEGALQSIGEARRAAESAAYPSDLLRIITRAHLLGREGSILGDPLEPNLGRPEEAIEPLGKAIDLVERLALQDPHDSRARFDEWQQGRVLTAILCRRDPRETLAIYDRCLRRLRETTASTNRQINEAECLAESSYPLLLLHRRKEAKQRVELAFALLRDLGDSPSAAVTLNSTPEDVLRAWAGYQEQTGNVSGAADTYRGLLQKVLAARPNPSQDLVQAYDLSRTYDALIRLALRTGQSARAGEWTAARLELWRAWDRRLPGNLAIHRLFLAAQLP